METRHARSEALSEEIPLLIEDFSCANSFEEHVKVIEQYLSTLFDGEPLLQSFLAAPVSTTAGGGAPSDRKSGEDIESGATASSTSAASPTTTSPSPASLSVNGKAASLSTASKIFGRTISLYAEDPIPLDKDLSIAVEVHVWDAAHPITQQYCTPLFFLIKKAAVNVSYRESETSYLLSLLSTAVRQMLLQQQRNRVKGGVLRLCQASGRAVAPCMPLSRRQYAPAASLLPSPFFYPDGCAPCFAPAGDSYKQTFAGIAPPLPTCAALPPMPVPPSSSSPAISAAEWTLLHQRSFTTRFLSDAFGHVPERCQSLSDYIDLFQLHVGQHSRICNDDFDGICVSLWKKYVLPVPWKFHPYGLSSHEKPNNSGNHAGNTRAADGDSVALPAASLSLTWESVLNRENEYARLLCGAFTHDFGTTASPLKHVLFHFQWNQLQDVEAHEAVGRASHLDPFQYALATTAPGTPPLGVLTFSGSAAAQAAQRKCSITMQAVVRDDKDIQHGVSERLKEVLLEGYLESFTNVTAARRTTPAHGGNESGDRRGAVTHPTQKPGGDKGAGIPTEVVGDKNESDADERCSEAQLRDLAACIVEWTGAKVTLQESLIQRFATPLALDDDKDGRDGDDANGSGDSDPGSPQPPRAVLGALRGKHSEAVVTRHLCSLWEEWEAHQQCCSGEGTALHRRRREGSAEHEKDLRRSYFPDSFFSRFAFVCATQVPHPTDVQALWRLCIDALYERLLVGSHEQKRENWQRVLDCLAMPPEDPPVDLSRPLLTQKLQLLRYSQEALLRSLEDNSSPTKATPAVSIRAEEDGASTSLTTSPVRHLITNGEILCVPPPLPHLPTTTDEVMKHAMELNSLDAAAVESASVEWLQTDALYNDMCLFLYANKAHEGRIVRFPDFVQWHSPRDFVAPARDESLTETSVDTSSPSLSDNDYLSERMQRQQKGGASGGKGSAHVWWSLWSRATPRSRDDIVYGLFQPLEQATKVLSWLADMPAAELLLEVSNASISNALHRMLCHRCVLGDDRAYSPSGRGLPSGKADASSRMPLSTPEAAHHSIPPTPRIRALHRYVQAKCAALTKDVAAASALFLSSRGTFGEGAAAQQSPAESEAKITEMLHAFFANALHHLGEIEVSVCTAVTLQYLLGFSTNLEVASTVRALSAPASMSQQHQATSLQMRTVTVSMSAWSTTFAKQFSRPETREVQESMVRLTCMAERPLDTCACFQQLVVHQDASRSLRLALALTKEVL
ncbi:hypothetical protein, conserved [Leishmania tarentolae]|uniref:Rab3 GTPase-activating protein catalytic subunit n=1 Tax=Leishmania tarentolae TaxID=5689 RepID=A0A640KI67_LEITA|nr:hypothetical protein, conserved [Leishmania tarentolae]